MLQIVFSDSECGTLKMATHWGPSSWDDGPIGFIFGDGEREPTQEEKNQAMAQLKAQWEAENRRARPVGGDPGDVLYPSVGLDIGPISGPDVERARFDLLTAWLGGDFPLPDSDPDNHTQRDMLWEQRQRDRERLLEGGKNGETVRIWYSNAPYSLCGFYDVLWQLRDCDCPVTALEMPRWMPLGDDTAQSCLNWGELSPGDWAAYLPLEREIPKNVRRAIAVEWFQLREENAPLRAVVNGRLHSVGEDFYDPFIRAHIHDRYFRVGQLIGEVLGRYQLGIGDWWIAKRIQAMETQGELITVSKGDGFYRNEMRRAQ